MEGMCEVKCQCDTISIRSAPRTGQRRGCGLGPRASWERPPWSEDTFASQEEDNCPLFRLPSLLTVTGVSWELVGYAGDASLPAGCGRVCAHRPRVTARPGLLRLLPALALPRRRALRGPAPSGTQCGCCPAASPGRGRGSVRWPWTGRPRGRAPWRRPWARRFP